MSERHRIIIPLSCNKDHSHAMSYAHGDSGHEWQVTASVIQVISPWPCITGCGIGPLDHRFTPKVIQKGVSEELKVSERHRIIIPLSYNKDHSHAMPYAHGNSGHEWQVKASAIRVISPWPCVTGCGIGPLDHRFTPKVIQKGVSGELKVSERHRIIIPLSYNKDQSHSMSYAYGIQVTSGKSKQAPSE